MSDFPPEEFKIVVFCDSCDHRANLDRKKVPEDMTVQELRQHLRCSDCGSRECSLRIIYSGAGGFQHCRKRPEKKRPDIAAEALITTRRSAARPTSPSLR